MKIGKSRLYRTVFTPSDVEDTKLPQVAVSGRSNVGKSSLINAILGRKGLARTSRSPGRTRSLNYYLVGDSFFLIDLPGYGYAKVSSAERESWKKLVEAYFREVRGLKGLLLLVDSRRDLEDEEYMLLQYLSKKGLPGAIVYTKVDRLNQRERAVLRKRALKASGEFAGTSPIFFSARSNEGKSDVVRRILEFVRDG